MISHYKPLGLGDIVRISVPPEARVRKVALISGRVFDAKTKKPLAAGVLYEILSSNTEVGRARSNPKSGAYSIILPSGSLYGFRAEAKGYYPVSEQLDTRALVSYVEIQRDLSIIPVEKNVAIRLNNLFFDFAKYDLRVESAAELDRLCSFLNSNVGCIIEIDGHTDNVGDEKSNKTLSQSRAKAVLDYIVGHGVAATRLSSKGFGKSKPVVTNDTEEGRQKNRRVEFVIKSN
jgi:outer membrane protein OmpA-like peptidoglycan-associated protein